MSSEKNAEVAGCNASIMKDVWEIRAREYRQKIQLEEERMEKSALPSINQDWANRLAGKLGLYKKVERKIKIDSSEKDNNNVWKGQQTHVPPPSPRGATSGRLSRPGPQSRSFSTQAPKYKDKNQQENKRFQLLRFITQSQPSAMIWGKSWKYNKCLPPAEGTTATSDWGQCWMFATKQPYTEEGKPWPNGPNTLDPQSLHLWKRAEYRMTGSRDLESNLPTDVWQMSWKSDMNQKKNVSSVNGEIATKSGLFRSLVETQAWNAALCSSDWSKSWQSTKAARQQAECFTDPNDGLMKDFGFREQDRKARHQDGSVTARWEECWRLANHHGCKNSKIVEVKHSHSPEWATSWKTAVVAFEDEKNSAPIMRQDDNDADEDCSQMRQIPLEKIRNQRYQDLHLQLCNNIEVLSEWNKSWQVVKNNVKPSEEMKKVLKAFESLKGKECENKVCSTSENINVSVKPKNEPIVEQHWEESWRFSKHQQANSQIIIGNSSEGSHYSFDLQAQVRYIRPVSDCQMAFEASESNIHHNKPSLTQWSKAWMSSPSIEHRVEQMSRDEWVNEVMEIQPPREFFLHKAKHIMSQTFDNQTFRESYPNNEWSASWESSSPLKLQLSLYESSGISGNSVSRITQQPHVTSSEHGSKFGRSFRLANPMPHMENQWVESSPNPYHHTVLWPAGKHIYQNKIKINTNCGQDPATLRLWLNSYVFMNVASAQISKSKDSSDPRVIIRKQINTKKQLCSYTKKEQSDRKWTGCHLLCKTQPCPKKISASMQKLRKEDETRDNFFEEWGESWRFSVQPGIMKKHMPSKSLLGWNESWKFLLPPHQRGNSPKVK